MVAPDLTPADPVEKERFDGPQGVPQITRGCPAAGLVRPPRLEAALPKAKITRVRIYEPPNLNPLFNQSDMVVTVETDIGITGIGEGGAKDTLEQCAGSLIGQNPFQIERLWQEMYIAWFYPPGREKIHAQGAMDLALWDIKGKALGLPVHQILGGSLRNHLECYNTGQCPLPRRRRGPPAIRWPGFAIRPAPPWRPATAPIVWERAMAALWTTSSIRASAFAPWPRPAKRRGKASARAIS